MPATRKRIKSDDRRNDVHTLVFLSRVAVTCGSMKTDESCHEMPVHYPS